MKIENLFGNFTWCWGFDFFIETELGNFHWKDPDYHGDGTITKFGGDYEDFLKMINVPFGRSKGRHKIGDYCGSFKFVDEVLK